MISSDFQQMSLVIEKVLYEQLRTEAFTQRKTMSKIVNELLRKHFEKQIKKRQNEK